MENKLDLKSVTAADLKYYIEQCYEELIQKRDERLKSLKSYEDSISEMNVSQAVSRMLKKSLFKKVTYELRESRIDLKVTDFTRIKVLGKGTFGKVVLVKDSKNMLFALKSVKKTSIVCKDQSGHLRAERDALIGINSKWIVNLYSSFQDEKNIYMLLEYVSGGDFRNLMSTVDSFDEETVRYYSSQLILGIDAIHKAGFIHRDLKPANLMLTDRGFLKITDFGLSTGFHWSHAKEYYTKDKSIVFIENHIKPMENAVYEFDSKTEYDKLKEILNNYNEYNVLDRRKALKELRKKTNSLVGTILYMSPDVLGSMGHDKISDWWSFGTIIFEMAIGYPAFYASSVRDCSYKIMNYKEYLKVPSGAKLSKSLTNLIMKTICSKNERLGKHGMVDFIENDFFSNFNWSFDSSQEPPKIWEKYTLLRKEDSVLNHSDDSSSSEDERVAKQNNKLTKSEVHMKELAFWKFTYKKKR